MSKLAVSHLFVQAGYQKGLGQIISDLSFSVEQGRGLAIVGESGCGKTMTALALLGIFSDNCQARGEAILDGDNLLALQSPQ